MASVWIVFFYQDFIAGRTAALCIYLFFLMHSLSAAAAAAAGVCLVHRLLLRDWSKDATQNVSRVKLLFPFVTLQTLATTESRSKTVGLVHCFMTGRLEDSRVIKWAWPSLPVRADKCKEYIHFISSPVKIQNWTPAYTSVSVGTPFVSSS